jgi:hypothetical protein
VLYNHAADLPNELSLKLKSMGNICDLLEAQPCYHKRNQMKTFDRVLFRRSGATNRSGIKQSLRPYSGYNKLMYGLNGRRLSMQVGSSREVVSTWRELSAIMAYGCVHYIVP